MRGKTGVEMAWFRDRTEPHWVAGFEQRMNGHVDQRIGALQAKLIHSYSNETAQLTIVLATMQQELTRTLSEVQYLLDVLTDTIIPGPAVGLRVQIIGGTMASTTLSVDVVGEQVDAQWVDDKGDPTVAPTGPDGAPASIVFSSSDSDVVDVGPATATATGAAAPLTFVKAGDSTLTASAVDSTGAPLVGFADGTTDLVLTPGAAAGLEVSVDSAPPVAAP